MQRLMSLALLGTCLHSTAATDWPTAGSDPRRSGHSPQSLATPLTLHWTYQSAHVPMPAWPRSDRQPFDRAYHPVLAGGNWTAQRDIEKMKK